MYYELQGGGAVNERKYTLKELRARNNLTQEQTAEKLGVSQTTYNAWEKDISNVGISKVQAVADLFKVKLGEIFFTPQHENKSC